MKDKNKTVFIIITRSFLIRNILRSGVLGHLQQSGCKIVVFLQTLKGKDVPTYLKDEFENESTIFEMIGSNSNSGLFERLHRSFTRWTSLLVYTDSTWSYSQAGNLNNRGRMFFWKYLERFVFSILTRVHFLKTIVRLMEEKIFTSDNYSYYFDKYKPDLVFATAIIGGIDVDFMKEAHARGIKTVGMTKGWDHASRVLYRFIPDKVLIQNDTMKSYLINNQRIRENVIKVCGFPQFDWYARNDLLVSREDFFRDLGFDTKKKLILFGSEGSWSPEDDTVAEMLSKFIDANKLSLPVCVLIRPHFSDIKTKRFDKFRKEGVIQIDSNITYQEFLPGNWDPGIEEIRYFVNLLYHMDILVNIASTLTLDACCFDKPIISIGFGVLHNLRNEKDVTAIYYEMNHYQDVLKTGAVDLVKSEEEFLESINRYLINPEYKKEERKVLLDRLCYRVDGNSAKCVAEEILLLLK